MISQILTLLIQHVKKISMMTAIDLVMDMVQMMMIDVFLKSKRRHRYSKNHSVDRKSKVNCFNCNELDHYANECRQRKNDVNNYNPDNCNDNTIPKKSERSRERGSSKNKRKMNFITTWRAHSHYLHPFNNINF